jgi:hypothetical protein
VKGIEKMPTFKAGEDWDWDLLASKVDESEVDGSEMDGSEVVRSSLPINH